LPIAGDLHFAGDEDVEFARGVAFTNEGGTGIEIDGFVRIRMQACGIASTILDHQVFPPGDEVSHLAIPLVLEAVFQLLQPIGTHCVAGDQEIVPTTVALHQKTAAKRGDAVRAGMGYESGAEHVAFAPEVDRMEVEHFGYHLALLLRVDAELAGELEDQAFVDFRRGVEAQAIARVLAATNLLSGREGTRTRRVPFRYCLTRRRWSIFAPR
tara:strand:- start:1554 stop:2189 length:636 start_codon:yes stop_codon:yes gene_type:complete